MTKKKVLAIMFICGSLALLCGQDPIPFTDGGKLGYVSPSFKWIIPPKYDKASDFQSGTALVSIGGTAQAIDAKGKLLFTLRESSIASFSVSGAYMIVEEKTIGFRIYDRKGTRLGGPFRQAFFSGEGRVIVRSSPQDLILWELPRDRKTRLPIKIEGLNDIQISPTSLPDVIQVAESLYGLNGRALALESDHPDLSRVNKVTKKWYVRWNGIWSDQFVLAFFRWGESSPFRVVKDMSRHPAITMMTRRSSLMLLTIDNSSTMWT